MSIRIRFHDAETTEEQLRETVTSHNGEVERVELIDANGPQYEVVANFPTKEDAQGCIDGFCHYADDGTTVDELAVGAGFE